MKPLALADEPAAFRDDLIEFLDTLPMTTTGKVQRRVLRELEAKRSQAAA